MLLKRPSTLRGSRVGAQPHRSLLRHRWLPTRLARPPHRLRQCPFGAVLPAASATSSPIHLPPAPALSPCSPAGLPGSLAPTPPWPPPSDSCPHDSALPEPHRPSHRHGTPPTVLRIPPGSARRLNPWLSPRAPGWARGRGAVAGRPGASTAGSGEQPTVTPSVGHPAGLALRLTFALLLWDYSACPGDQPLPGGRRRPHRSLCEKPDPASPAASARLPPGRCE